MKAAGQVTGASQSLVTVKVTVAVPPQAGGAPLLLFDKMALQPPLNVTSCSQAANAASISACVWQASSVTSSGQVKLTTGAAVTVNDAWQVTGASQLLVTVKVTVDVPPQASGAPVLLFVKMELQPPLKFALASHVAYAVFTSACVRHAATVMLVGQVKLTAGAAVTENVA